MPQTITISLPDEVYEHLAQWTRQIGQTPEHWIAAWISRSVQETLQDPLIQLAGTIESDVTDVSERHDEYLGQAILDEMRGGQDG